MPDPTSLLAGLALILAPALSLALLRLWDWWTGAWRRS